MCVCVVWDEYNMISKNDYHSSSMGKQMLAVSHNQTDKPRKPNWRLTILAAVEVCMSFHTVSESTPMPPHSKKQNRIGKFSGRRQKLTQVSKIYQKSSLQEDKNQYRLARPIKKLLWKKTNQHSSLEEDKNLTLVSKTYQKCSLEEDKNWHRLTRSKKFSGWRPKNGAG